MSLGLVLGEGRRPLKLPYLFGEIAVGRFKCEKMV